MPSNPEPTAPEPTQPLTDEDVRAIKGRRRGAVQSLNGCDCMQPDSHGIVLDSLGDVPRLLAEVDRLRAENTAQAAKLDAVRKIQPQRRNSAMVTSEQLATMYGWNDAVNAIREALEPCTCTLTDPSTWETYGGLTEPGSTYQWEPDCPAHGDAPALDQSGEGQTNG
jgi:hypothetical protein